MRRFYILFIIHLACQSVLAQLPPGFKSIFNGRNLKGWHISRSTHQGTTPKVEIQEKAIIISQFPFGQGGVLLTNEVYKDFELYMEVKIDSFTNGGIFLRSNEGGAAYQIELDLAHGLGNLLGERIQIGTPGEAKDILSIWKINDWNSFRIRMVGAIPQVTVWVNNTMLYNVQQTKNDFIAKATEGMIGLQCHWTALYDKTAGSELMPLDSWRPGSSHRFRNIGIKRLNN